MLEPRRGLLLTETEQRHDFSSGELEPWSRYGTKGVEIVARDGATDGKALAVPGLWAHRATLRRLTLDQSRRLPCGKAAGSMLVGPRAATT